MRSKQRHRTQNFPQASKEQREHLDNVNLWHQYRKVYLKAWTLSLVIVLAEVIGAAASGSRALQADIGHVAGDVIIASAPLIMSTLPSRGESRLILATGGVLTALTLAAIGIIIGIEAWQDLRGTGHGHHVGGWTMSAFALMAGLLNFWQHRILSIVSPRAPPSRPSRLSFPRPGGFDQESGPAGRRSADRPFSRAWSHGHLAGPDHRRVDHNPGSPVAGRMP